MVVAAATMATEVATKAAAMVEKAVEGAVENTEAGLAEAAEGIDENPKSAAIQAETKEAAATGAVTGAWVAATGSGAGGAAVSVAARGS